MAINKTNIEVSAANFSTWWDEMKRREKFEESQNERLKKEISRLRKSEEAAERWSEASERKKIGFDPTKVEKSISRRCSSARFGFINLQTKSKSSTSIKHSIFTISKQSREIGSVVFCCHSDERSEESIAHSVILSEAKNQENNILDPSDKSSG